jgi:hypothetical protein
MLKTKNGSTKKQKIDIIEKWVRECPTCKSKMVYRHASSFYTARKKNGRCSKCSSKYNAIRFDYSNLYSGKGNPFYGRHHTDETKKVLSDVDRSWLTGSNNPMKNPETQQHFSKIFTGSGNPMYGTHMSDERKIEQSNRFSGKGNPMYGKPTPQGSGNGWANWYKGRHFRSLRELQYFIDEVDEKGIVCETAQRKSFRIPYKDKDGNDRTYSPDFFVGGNTLVEIKPVKLWNTKSVQVKKSAAEEFCKKHGWTYKLVDIQPNSMLLKEKYLNGEIRFIEKYKERFEKYAKI